MNLTDRQQRALDALQEITDEGGHDASALEIALRAGIGGNARHGNGAVKGSWSGTTSPALAIASTLRGLERKGLIDSYYVEGRTYYSLRG